MLSIKTFTLYETYIYNKRRVGRNKSQLFLPSMLITSDEKLQ